MEFKKYSKIPQDFVEQYTRSHYRVVGKHKHTALKPCHWLEQKLLTGRDNRNCYKGYWGIKSETCIQNSPSYPFCNHNCAFCWRLPNGNLDSKFTVEPDDPVYLIDELIRHHKNIIENNYPLEKSIQNLNNIREIMHFILKNADYTNLSKIKISANTLYETFSKAIPKGQLNNALTLLRATDVLLTDDMTHFSPTPEVQQIIKENKEDPSIIIDKKITNEQDLKKTHQSALNPCHAAISLDGEPTLYPFIGEFIGEFRKRRFTTFIVTNGTCPDVIQSLEDNAELPTILYVTLPPPNLDLYYKICKPRSDKTWEKIHQTLKLLKNLKTRTVLRITSVKNLNITPNLIEQYVALINDIQPNFLDIKGFTLEGGSMTISNRLGTDHTGAYYVPEFEDLFQFALELQNKGNYEIIQTHQKSRDILLRINWPKNKSIKIEKNEI
jgi:wyosine [tRNA(Phe)-imidazoG37] synthetase (radical SAM superfamily)